MARNFLKRLLNFRADKDFRVSWSNYFSKEEPKLILNAGIQLHFPKHLVENQNLTLLHAENVHTSDVYHYILTF